MQKHNQFFLEDYKKLKEDISDGDLSAVAQAGKIFFVDAAHFIHNTIPAMGWIEKGKSFPLPCNAGRDRINVLGALNPIDRGIIAQYNDTRCNAETIKEFFSKIEQLNPTISKIHLILDNARYNHARIVKDFVRNSRIELHFLPPYSPNLNLIERFWKFLKGKLMKNKYHETLNKFKTALATILNNIGKYAEELRTLLTDNFQIIESV